METSASFDARSAPSSYPTANESVSPTPSAVIASLRDLMDRDAERARPLVAVEVDLEDRNNNRR
jgi:hypothetical protein